MEVEVEVAVNVAVKVVGTSRNAKPVVDQLRGFESQLRTLAWDLRQKIFHLQMLHLLFAWSVQRAC